MLLRLAGLIAADQQGAHYNFPYIPIEIRQKATVHGAHQNVLGDTGGLGTHQLKACWDLD
ncbi:hypothetical protein INR49_012916 [Caranx melampygus]|nr:hypothetical protein INR49_012916 [Caranx melampygus]